MKRRCLGLIAAFALLCAGCSDDDSGQNNFRPDSGVIPICGNGLIETGEECDDGAQNSDTRADACRTSCRAPYCGDAVVDTGEVCDEGLANSDRLPNACRKDCTDPICGDDVIDENEECDDGLLNSSAPGACRPDCHLPACDDGVMDPDQVCFDYYGVTSPTGFFSPLHVDGDHLPDIAGNLTRSAAIWQTFRNTGSGFDRNRQYLVPRWSDPTTQHGRLSQSGTTTWLVVGTRPPLLTRALPDGRLELPTVVQGYRARDVAGVTNTAGDRFVTWVKDGDHCRVALDASGLLDPATRLCENAGLEIQESLVLPTLLPTTDSSLIVARPSSASPTLHLFMLDQQARLAGHQEYVDNVTDWGTESQCLGHAIPTSGDLHWVTYRVPSGGGDNQVAIKTWDATQKTFGNEETWHVPWVLLGGSAFTSMGVGRLGGNSTRNDVAILDDLGNVIILHHTGTGYDVSETCGGGEALGVIDLDDSGDDEIIVIDRESNQLHVFGHGVAGVPCSPAQTFDLPFRPGSLQAAFLDGDAFGDVIVRRETCANGGENERGLWAAMILRGGSTLTTEYLPAGSELREVWVFPQATDPLSADLVFSTWFTEVVQGDDAPVGLFAMEGGSYLTGRPIRATNEDPFESEINLARVADVDHDGVEDLVLLTDEDLHVYYGPYDAGASEFDSHDEWPMAKPYRWMELADLDEDGLPDLLLLTNGLFRMAYDIDAEVTVLTNEPGFGGTPATFATEFGPQHLTVGDFNEDGHEDVATVHINASVMAVLLGDGAGHLALDQVYLIPGLPFSATAGHLDGDNHLDLVVSTALTGLGPIWLQGSGDGSFKPAQDLSLTAGEFHVALFDMNADGHDDLVTNRWSTEWGIAEYSLIVLQGTP